MIQYTLLVLGFLLIFINLFTSVNSKNFLGIAPEDEKYYMPDIIKCKDGSKKFTKDQLNDEFCDCPDGTDEPGTSACPEGKFYCRNAGHASVVLFSSRVNDGICDCCDGSDEYDGGVKCLNTCWEAGQVARDKLKKKIETYRQGVTLRKQLVEQAEQALAKDEAELSQLKNEEKTLKGIVQRLKVKKEMIEKAEEQERLRKEKEEKKLQEDNDQARKKENHPQDDAGGLTEHMSDPSKQPAEQETDEFTVEDIKTYSDKREPSKHVLEVLEQENENHVEEKEHTGAVDDGNEVFSSHSREQVVEGPADTENLSREELGRLVASRWTGENIQEKSHTMSEEKELEKDEKQLPRESDQDNEYSGYHSETDEEDHKHDVGINESNIDEYTDEEHDDTTSYDHTTEAPSDFSDFQSKNSESTSWLDKILHSVRNIFQVLNIFQTPINKSEAAYVRKDYDESNSKLSKIESKISSLTEKLKHDYGKENEFYSFFGHCFESKQNKYVYKVCPFKQASQVEGYITTTLGRWENFEESYRVMLFSNGDKCWNGPDRSLKVKLRCGLENELADVDEPSRCEYVAFLSTPAVCVEKRLKELEDKLILLNSKIPKDHDEL